MKKLFLIALATTLFLSCKKESSIVNREKSSASLKEMISENGQNPDEINLPDNTSARKKNESHVYTESNDAGTNHVVIYKKNADGSLTHQSNVASGGAGTGSLFGSQGALVLDNKHEWLYAVNAGSNSVSSFKVGDNGGLTLAYTIASGGRRPVSVTVNKT